MNSADMKIQITPDTKVGELLECYPELENILIAMAPPFKKLTNPMLKKTVAKVTSLKQAAIVGNVSLGKMINELRKAAGMELVSCNEHSCNEEKFSVSDEQIIKVYDARQDLENGIVPVIKVMNELKAMKAGEALKLITPFLPAPMIDKAKEKGYKTNCKQIDSECFETVFVIN